MSQNKPSPSGKMLDAETWDALKASGYTKAKLLAEQPFGPGDTAEPVLTVMLDGED